MRPLRFSGRRIKRDCGEELDNQLIETIPLMNEANEIASELKKPMEFAIKLVSDSSSLTTMVENNRRGSASSLLSAHLV